MQFRNATDTLCAKIDHTDIARALGVSTQTVRQARLYPGAAAHRPRPDQWETALVRLAEERVNYYRQFIEQLRLSQETGAADNLHQHSKLPAKAAP